MMSTTYADAYRNIDFRKEPQKYPIGRGEQGVLIAEPYKSELLPHWKFATPSVARASAETIYRMYLAYKHKQDFVGMDMARKFLQMGFTRARRYANHRSGRKYNSSGKVYAQSIDWKTSEKAQSAEIFKSYWDEVRTDKEYLSLKQKHRRHIGTSN